MGMTQALQDDSSDRFRCPHGNHVAETRADEELRAACKVCGGPRIALQADNIKLSGKEQAPLGRAESARTGRFLWRTTTAFAAAGGALAGLAGMILTAIWGAGLFTAGLPITFAALMFTLSTVAFMRSKSLSKIMAKEINVAWKHAARDVLQQCEGAVTGQQLVEKLGLSSTAAEGLLSELAVDSFIDSDITSEGELTFAPAMRIDTSGADLANAVDADLEARFEALAAAEASAAESATATVKK